MVMGQLAKMLVLVGLLIALVGVVMWLISKMGFQGLPGDIRYEGRHVRLYFPVVTCVVVSIVVTGLAWLISVLIRWWSGGQS